MMLWSCRVLCAAVVGVLVSAAHAQESYRGMCDASAAVALGEGRFVVADDERDVLRVYRRGQPDGVASVDLIDYLGNRKSGGKKAEADIEGAAAIGLRIYWIASHARRGKDGTVDPHRRRFFATEIVNGPSGPTVVAAADAPYEMLLEDLLADPRFAVFVEAAERKPEDKGGLNIEGLAATPAGGLLIGFRNPLPQGRALVVPLSNPRQVLNRSEKPRFGDLIRLDLGGRGIRSFERVGNEVLIAAGPYAMAASRAVQPAFALFRWSGAAGDQPSFVRGLDAGTFRAEAMFADPDSRELVLLSDDGDETVNGADCKDKDVHEQQKTFRVRSFALPLTNATACTVDKTATFAGKTLRLGRSVGLPASANVGLFKAPLAVNTDGAPTSYHPDDYTGERLALNHIDNGIVIKSSSGRPLTLAQRKAAFDQWKQSGDWSAPAGFTINWQNVIAADHGKPCVFRQTNAGYFGSLTALKNGLSTTAAGECGVNDQLDQRFVPALVLRGTSNPLRSWGASVGDLVLAIHPRTGVMVPALIGDTGDEKRLGEGSVALNLALQTGARMPTTYTQAKALDTGTQAIVVAVLPSTRQLERERPYTKENIDRRVRRWAEANGYGSVQALGEAAVRCAAGL